ncbi:TIGR04255 family protein [Allosphingosinicella deserti]|uniref:TIGR04255 family protein n=1 Tax=Allosphingosinicella deserti TaxID=2116704 RepID=A0A2P7QEC6_9SPHN|nr:TIGR04255 family protein [Sphingomonas deserti]PSJ36285.1 hypothetical protein C7I55_26690 [Sphingomonas deserti]
MKPMEPVIHNLPTPLGGPPPSEVLLVRAPLARVLAQVKFPYVLFIEDKAHVAPFQADLRAEYPVFRQDEGRAFHIEMAPNGPNVQANAVTVWRFTDVSGGWTVTLSPDAVTLETRQYDQRSDFIARFSRVLDAVERHFEPGVGERLGIRYVTRVVGDGYERLHEIVQPNLMGVAIPPLREYVTHAISEASMSAEDSAVIARWGMLPPQGTFDPVVLEPVGEPSWVLDIDVSTAGYHPFDAQDMADRFNMLAERAYSVFRYMVTDEFLTLYGGQP